VLHDEELASAQVDGLKGPATLVFELTVTDPDGLVATDTVRVTVRSK